MTDLESLKHTRWECKYHMSSSRRAEEKDLWSASEGVGFGIQGAGAAQESKVEEGHLMSDHVHMLVSIPPKYSVSQVVGYLKGKSAIHIARTYMGRRQNFVGQNFWARGYYVSTVGRTR